LECQAGDNFNPQGDYVRYSISSPALAVEVISGYAAAGALGYIYMKGLVVIPQITAGRRLSVFVWLNESIGLMALILYVWVTLYFFYESLCVCQTQVS
jgi:hypothetical protein